jgi:2,4-dienoyl-CoA reductase (NADPH2)
VPTGNRLVKTAAGASFSDDNGITEKDKAYYGALARGGVGLIIMGGYIIENPLGADLPSLSGAHDDKYLAGFSELTQLVHKHGCPIFLQLFHGGAMHPSESPGFQPVSASPLTESEIRERIPPHMKSRVPRGLTIPEIEEIVDRFARAAERAQQAGFDGVEINAGTCHLGNSFLSRAWNRRQDAYGCDSSENRTRFVVEIIQETKKRLGQDFPVTVLFNIAEFGIAKGITIEEGKDFARTFEQAGADAIQARVYGYGDYSRLHWPEHVFYPEPPQHLTKELDWSHRGAGAFLPLSQAIKKVVSIPVIVAGRLDPELGEKALQQGKIDFVGMTRRLMADPELPNKIASGRPDDIAPCTACHHCSSAVGEGQPAICRVNAALGSEQEYVIKPADKKKRVMVVGGGPAGMEAARVAARRGHEVILYEQERKLGGLLPLAALVKGVDIEDLPKLRHYLKTQITRLGVKVNLGKKVNLSLIKESQPDVVILATGRIPTLPEIPGIDRRIVVSAADLHRKVKVYLRLFGPKVLRWLTRFWMPIGKRVVIIGGDMQGCELAEFLVKRGRKVTIVDTAEAPGEAVPIVNRVYLLEWLTNKGVTTMTGVKYEEITEKGINVITKEGKRQTIEADTIVPALPLTPDTELLRSLEGKVPELYHIGDGRQPGLILDAIADGWRISQNI